MKLRHSTYLIAVVALVMMIAGCSGSGSSPNPPNPQAITVALSPQAPSTINPGATASITAVVSNDSANAGVKWSVSCGSSPCGSFSAASTASGAPTQYTAPGAISNPTTVTVTATSVTDSAKSASASIAISAPTAISVSLNTPPASLATGASAALTATVSNDSADAGVTWSVTCGSAQCGSFNPTTTLSGTATNYTAPAVLPSPATVNVTATSVTDPTKSASGSITITSAAPAVLADGNYVFHLAGYDGGLNYYVAGAFTVQNGVITGGEQDLVDRNQSSSDTLAASGSSLSLVNGNVQIVLNTNDLNVGANGVETFHGTVVSNARVLISEFDSFASATGSIDLQTSTAAPAGGYAFNVGGLDGNGVPLVVGGILNISGASVSVGNSVYDYNDGGTIGQNQSFASGTVSNPDSFGRVVFTLNPSSNAAGLTSFQLAGYTVGTNQIQLVELNDTLQGDLGGTALGQGSNTGQFNQASVAGGSYAYGANGQDDTSAGGSKIVQIAGGFGLNADGTVSGKLTLNDLFFNFGSQITSGTYTVDSTGRVTINVTVTSGSLPNTPSFAFQLYLDGNGNALELGVDNTQATSGLAFLQQAPSSDFEGNYAMNVYGYSSINQEPAWAAVGPVTVASDAFSGYTDYSVQDPTNSFSILTPGVTLSGSEDSSTGLLTLYGLNAQNVMEQGNPIQSGFGYYPIDSRRVIAIELDSQQMGLMMLEGTQPN